MGWQIHSRWQIILITSLGVVISLEILTGLEIVISLEILTGLEIVIIILIMVILNSDNR